MERDVLVLIARVVWFIEDQLPWLIVLTLALILIGTVLLIDWIIDRRK